MAPHADHAAGSLGVAAAGNAGTGRGRIGRDGEGAMPELAVKMLRVIALDALAAAEAHVDRAPGREKGGKGAHVGLRRAAAAEARRDLRVARCVQEAARADGVELLGDEVEGLVPGDRHEARVLVAPLLRVGALHRREDAIRVVGLLHEAVGLDADLAGARMDAGRAEIRLDADGDAVVHLDREEIGTRRRTGSSTSQRVSSSLAARLVMDPLAPAAVGFCGLGLQALGTFANVDDEAHMLAARDLVEGIARRSARR